MIEENCSNDLIQEIHKLKISNKINNNNDYSASNNYCSVGENSTIEDFFANKNVFITGSTGFLGTVLLEAVLSTSPKVGKIYVLVRDKKGASAISRIQRLLTKPVSVFLFFHNFTSIRLRLDK